MEKGILLIAAGHPYYGKMAVALAASIRVVDTTMPIHLAYASDGIKYLTINELALFTSTKIIPESYYTLANGNKAFIRCKMFLYQLSPFTQTLFLDSDLLWFKKQPTKLLEQLKGIDITYQNHGFADLALDKLPVNYTLWADINEVKAAYQLTEGKYYQVHSELVYFEKTDIAKKYFKAALKLYDNLKVKATVFAGAVPDELPFAIASAQLGIYPHQNNFTPIYWAKAMGNTDKLYLLYDKYYGMSMAGHLASTTERDNYNLLTKAAYEKLGLQHPYQWKNKKTFLHERKIL